MRGQEEDQADDRSVDSEEALCDVLGIPSLKAVATTLLVDDDAAPSHDDATSTAPPPSAATSLEDVLQRSDEYIAHVVEKHNLRQIYSETAVCTFPPELSVPASVLRRLTDELVWNGERDYPQVLRTYESVTVMVRRKQEQHTTERQPNGDTDEASPASAPSDDENGSRTKTSIIEERRRVLTRLENLNSHAGWHALCNNYIRRCVSAVCGSNNKNGSGERMSLYKTKLNLKPPGTAGFAPHVDAPSLASAFGDQGPRSFVTVMLAIDDMTVRNGCLRVAATTAAGAAAHDSKKQREPWSADNVPLVPPEANGDPDAGGRAGAIPLEVANSAEKMPFRDVPCNGGTLTAFGGWVPHRSAANRSPCAPRRAAFLTYHPAADGDFHDLYYERMAQRRRQWKEQQQQQQQQIQTQLQQAAQEELEALSTIPRI